MPKLTTTRIANLGKPRIVTIGEGFGGLEVVQRLKGLRCRTIHLKKSSSNLINSLAEKSSIKVLEYLHNTGGKIDLNCSVQSYNSYEVAFNTGEKLPCRKFALADGVKYNPLNRLTSEVVTTHNSSRQLQIDEFNYVNILAIGDVTTRGRKDKDFINGHSMTTPSTKPYNRAISSIPFQYCSWTP